MNPLTRFKILTVIALTLIVSPPSAHAAIVPVSGRFVDDARGDAAVDQLLGGSEIGDDALFPLAAAIHYHTHRSYQLIGAANDGIANDWTVHMTNVSGQAWTNLFFVADMGATIGNADGTVEDLAAAPGLLTDAFHIDAVGANPNLLTESLSADGIFQPGEEWEFAVTNFGTGLNSLPPSLITPGVFAGSSSMQSFGGTNASILASPVPEPGALAATTALVCMVLLRSSSRIARIAFTCDGGCRENPTRPPRSDSMTAQAPSC